mmetsp:Transcript_23698/g.78015  ORF Transcript_23698/g.78015 Transcript_23698/m.78015 type:complete len:280 (+) Transcript_23698:243-1082(+)
MRRHTRLRGTTNSCVINSGSLPMRLVEVEELYQSAIVGIGATAAVSLVNHTAAPPLPPPSELRLGCSRRWRGDAALQLRRQLLDARLCRPARRTLGPSRAAVGRRVDSGRRQLQLLRHSILCVSALHESRIRCQRKRRRCVVPRLGGGARRRLEGGEELRGLGGLAEHCESARRSRLPGRVVVHASQLCEWRRAALRRLARTLNLENLHGEDEAVAGSDVAALAAVAVCELRRNVELPFVAGHHELHRLCPARDHTRRREGGRIAARVRAVKGLALGRL